jgi:hypothetical protein
LKAEDALLHIILVVDTSDDIGVCSFARYIPLEHHLRFTKSARKSFISRVGEEIELALVLIGVTLSFGDQDWH